MNILIAGASGYIGKALIPKLLEVYPYAKITALSRSQQESNDDSVFWKACDLFSLKSLEQAIPANIDVAIYLVHSMGPTAALDQGSFADYDLILADNFSRAVQKCGIKQMIYLGGLVPELSDLHGTGLSLHLRSRLEVEEVFSQYKFNRTIFRAGLILGEAGSSFQILLKLVKRLPIMICPHWTQTLTTPVDLLSVLQSIVKACAQEQHFNKTYDLAGCRPLSYVEMMKQSARKMGLKRLFIAIPFFTPTLSRLWVSLITNSSKDLVYPLVESLEHNMLARKSHLFPGLENDLSYFEMLDKVKMHTQSLKSFFEFKVQRKTVRSVQRLVLPENKTAEWVKEKYISWLPRFLAPLIKVRVLEQNIQFSILSKKLVLLDLKYSVERSTPDRQLLYIEKGLLVSKYNKGRLEFREVLNSKYVLAAIHDFHPSLNWFVYKLTQANMHLMVMNAFGRYLKRK